MPDETRSIVSATPDPGGSPATADGDAPATNPIDGTPASGRNRAPSTGDAFTLLSEIARGGMGVVYRARDNALGRDVAVKMLQQAYPDDSPAVRRFWDEAKITGQLQHPGIPPIYQVGTFPDGRPFLAMKLIKGDTLADLLAGGGKPNLVAAFEQICHALGYAHSRNVLHRDLKPGNIMVGAFGEVQVMDWGLAKVLDGAAPTSVLSEGDDTASVIRTERDDEFATRAGSIMGTPAYMPPEQAIGAIDQIDQRSDVFGLGAILAAILTGQPPFIGANAESTRQLAARGNVEDCFARLAACGAEPGLVSLCKRCLSPEKGHRPADGGEVAAAVAELRAAADERARQAELDRVRVDGERAKAEAEAHEQRKRRRVQLVLAGAVGLLAATGGAFGWYADRQATQRREADIRQVFEAEQRAAAERDRQGRNADAVVELLRQAETDLRAGRRARAELALNAAERRMSEGGADELASRLAALKIDAAILAELDAVDRFRWTTSEKTYPPYEEVAARYREAFGKFSLDPESRPPEEVSARVSASAVRDRVVAALDRLLWLERSSRVRACLVASDPDPFRGEVRNAVAAGAGLGVAELSRRNDALTQPPWFTTVLGENGSIPVERRRELLNLAAGRGPDLGVLMTLGLSYPTHVRNGADERARWFQAAVMVAPDNPAVHKNLGLALWDHGNRTGAVAVYRRVVEIDPENAKAYLNLGLALRDTGEVGGAVAAYRRGVELDPGDAKIHTGLGIALMDQGDVGGATAAFRRATELGPKDSIAHSNLGIALMDRGDVGGATAAFRRAIELDPGDAKALTGLGQALMDSGNLRGAAAAFRRAVELDPKFGPAHNNLGNVLAKLGEPDAAVVAFRRAIELDPRLAAAHYNLGNVLFRKGDPVGAIAAYNQAIELAPTHPEAHCNLGSALRKVGEFEQALAHLRRGHELGSRRPEWRYPSAQWVADCEEALARRQEPIAPPPREKP